MLLLFFFFLNLSQDKDKNNNKEEILSEYEASNLKEDFNSLVNKKAKGIIKENDFIFQIKEIENKANNLILNYKIKDKVDYYLDTEKLIENFHYDLLFLEFKISALEEILINNKDVLKIRQDFLNLSDYYLDSKNYTKIGESVLSLENKINYLIEKELILSEFNNILEIKKTHIEIRDEFWEFYPLLEVVKKNYGTNNDAILIIERFDEIKRYSFEESNDKEEIRLMLSSIYDDIINLDREEGLLAELIKEKNYYEKESKILEENKELLMKINAIERSFKEIINNHKQ